MTTILELRERAKRDLRVLFGKKEEDMSEASIMFLIGCYQTDVDVVDIAIAMIDKDSFECPITGEDRTEYSEEERAQRRWEQTKRDRLK